MDLETLAEQVKNNLVHYNLWSGVDVHEIDNYDGSKVLIMSGKPPADFDSENTGCNEWVIPKVMENRQDMCIEEIDNWFVQILKITDDKERPKRVTIGLVNDDATVVYYFIHDGIVKPRQN